MQNDASTSSVPAGGLGVQTSATSEAGPDKVWSTIGDFSAIADWHPAVESCHVEDKDGRTLRTLTLNGGGTLVEELVAFDDAARSYSYRIVEGPLPVDHYLSTLSVQPEGTGSRIDWRGTFDAHGTSNDEATGVISSVYEAGLAALVEASGR